MGSAFSNPAASAEETPQLSVTITKHPQNNNARRASSSKDFKPANTTVSYFVIIVLGNYGSFRTFFREEEG
jgi:hypothetical protein